MALLELGLGLVGFVAGALALDHVDEGGDVLLGGGDIRPEPVELLALQVVLLVAADQLAPQLLDGVLVPGLGGQLALPQRVDAGGQQRQQLLLRQRHQQLRRSLPQQGARRRGAGHWPRELRRRVARRQVRRVIRGRQSPEVLQGAGPRSRRRGFLHFFARFFQQHPSVHLRFVLPFVLFDQLFVDLHLVVVLDQVR